MYITFVHVHVKSNFINQFISATEENAQNSIHEPGNIRFDFFQQADDPSRFVLIEIYRTSQEAANHKDTVHYKKWRDNVAEMMAEPRIGIKYSNISPTDSDWK